MLRSGRGKYVKTKSIDLQQNSRKTVGPGNLGDMDFLKEQEGNESRKEKENNEKKPKEQDVQTDSEMIEALLTSTRAIQNAVMEFAVKTLCSSQDVNLYINGIVEHKNLNDKCNEAFQMTKENMFGYILRKERKISSKIKNLSEPLMTFWPLAKLHRRTYNTLQVRLKETVLVFKKH